MCGLQGVQPKELNQRIKAMPASIARHMGYSGYSMKVQKNGYFSLGSLVSCALRIFSFSIASRFSFSSSSQCAIANAQPSKSFGLQQIKTAELLGASAQARSRPQCLQTSTPFLGIGPAHHGHSATPSCCLAIFSSVARMSC